MSHINFVLFYVILPCATRGVYFALWLSRPRVSPGRPFNLEETQTQVVVDLGSKQFSTVPKCYVLMCLAFVVSSAVCCFGYMYYELKLLPLYDI